MAWLGIAQYPARLSISLHAARLQWPPSQCITAVQKLVQAQQSVLCGSLQSALQWMSLNQYTDPQRACVPSPDAGFSVHHAYWCNRHRLWMRPGCSCRLLLMQLKQQGLLLMARPRRQPPPSAGLHRSGTKSRYQSFCWTHSVGHIAARPQAGSCKAAYGVSRRQHSRARTAEAAATADRVEFRPAGSCLQPQLCCCCCGQAATAFHSLWPTAV